MTVAGQEPAPQCWLVLGATSAIARAFALTAARNGADLLLAGRDLDELSAIAADIRIRTGQAADTIRFDAADADTHAAFAEDVAARAGGRLNVLLAFGQMPAQAEIDADPALGRMMVRVNVTGAMSVLAHLTPLFMRQRAGHIVGIGSVAGDRGRASNYGYGATKAALHAYLSGLRHRLGPLGVKVTAIKPGFVDTAMTYGLPGMFLVASPEDAARAIWRHAMAGRATAYVPWFWRIIMAIIRNLPDVIFRRLKL